jgi:hypothetical protein
MWGVIDSLWEDHFNEPRYEGEGSGCGPTAKKCRYCGKENLWFHGNILKERVKGTWVRHECDFSSLLEASK